MYCIVVAAGNGKSLIQKCGGAVAGSGPECRGLCADEGTQKRSSKKQENSIRGGQENSSLINSSQDFLMRTSCPDLNCLLYNLLVHPSKGAAVLNPVSVCARARPITNTCDPDRILHELSY